MNKSELIESIAESTDIGKGKAGEALNAALDAITQSLAKGNEVSLVGFGTFKVSKRKARMGHNPATGESIKIAASTVPSFKAGKPLKDAVNKR